LEIFVLFNNILYNFFVSILPLVFRLTELVKSINVSPALMLDEESQVNKKQGAASTDTGLIIDEDLLFVFINHFMQ